MNPFLIAGNACRRNDKLRRVQISCVGKGDLNFWGESAVYAAGIENAGGVYRE
jgi:hypothetical protein